MLGVEPLPRGGMHVWLGAVGIAWNCGVGLMTEASKNDLVVVLLNSGPVRLKICHFVIRPLAPA